MACAFLCELARAWCQSGCSIGVLTARLTFHPPPPSYVLVAINAAEGKDTADAASDAASRAFSNSAHPSATPETERQDSADTPSRLNTRLLHGRADSSGNVGTQHGRVGTSTAASFAAQPPAHGPGSESQGSAAPAPGAGGRKVPEIELQDVAPPDGDMTEAAAGEETDSAPTDTRGSDGGSGVTGQVQRVARVVTGASAGAGTGAGSGGARTWHGFAPTSQFRVMWLAQGPLPPEYSSMLSVHRVTTRRKNTIPVFLYKYPGASHTILFSHGNATDCGHMRDQFVDLCVSLRVNVAAYEYGGYGVSTGEPSEKGCYADIEAAYNCVVASAGTGTNVIVYGQSVGSGPSCWLARRKPVHSLVIHSGFMSGLRVMTDNRLLCCFDIFPNMSALQRVTVPVFIIHGQHDEEVPIHHAIGNLNAISSEPQIQPWLPEFGTHNDLYHRFRAEYLDHLFDFLAQTEVPDAVRRSSGARPVFRDPLGRMEFRGVRATTVTAATATASGLLVQPATPSAGSPDTNKKDM